MRFIHALIGGWLLVSCVVALCYGQSHEPPSGGFREVLEIAEIDFQAENVFSDTEFTDKDWELFSQILSRLEQHKTELGRWTLPAREFSPQFVGEIFAASGTLEHVEPLSVPTELAERLELREAFRCRVKLGDGTQVTVLSKAVPRRLNLSQPLSEPVSFRGVLLVAGDQPSLLTTHLSWFPTSGVPSGQLLLARFGMDASLWDEIVQRSRFVSPDKGREAEAFYSGLAVLKKVPSEELAQLANENIDRVRKTVVTSPAKTKEQQIASLVAEQAERGLSSVIPFFVEPQNQVGEVVRIEGTVRRAVRIVVDEIDAVVANQPLHEYFELEVFTPDSQNLPVVCCVASLPAGFPTGDAIRTAVRLDGLFFKLWQYQARKDVETTGETTARQASYTPVLIAPTVTWLQQTSPEPSAWGLVFGGIIFAAMIFGLLKMVLSSRQDRLRRMPDNPPDFSEME